MFIDALRSPDVEMKKEILHESRFLEAPFVRMLRMRSASLNIVHAIM